MHACSGAYARMHDAFWAGVAAPRMYIRLGNVGHGKWGVCMYVCMYYLGTSIAWGGAESEYVSAAFCGSAGSEKRRAYVCMYVCLHVRTYYVGIYLSWRGEGIYIRMLARKSVL